MQTNPSVTIRTMVSWTQQEMDATGTMEIRVFAVCMIVVHSMQIKCVVLAEVAHQRERFLCVMTQTTDILTLLKMTAAGIVKILSCVAILIHVTSMQHRCAALVAEVTILSMFS